MRSVLLGQAWANGLPKQVHQKTPRTSAAGLVGAHRA